MKNASVLVGMVFVVILCFMSMNLIKHNDELTKRVEILESSWTINSIYLFDEKTHGDANMLWSKIQDVDKKIDKLSDAMGYVYIDDNTVTTDAHYVKKEDAPVQTIDIHGSIRPIHILNNNNDVHVIRLDGGTGHYQ